MSLHEGILEPSESREFAPTEDFYTAHELAALTFTTKSKVKKRLGALIKRYATPDEQARVEIVRKTENGQHVRVYDVAILLLLLDRELAHATGEAPSAHTPTQPEHVEEAPTNPTTEDDTDAPEEPPTNENSGDMGEEPQKEDVVLFEDEEIGREREKLEAVQNSIEDVRVAYAQGQRSALDVARTLGNIAFDITPEETADSFHLADVEKHRHRVEILAFDALVRALKDVPANDTEGYDRLFGEIVSQIIDTDITPKRTYFTGILMHRCTADRQNADAWQQREREGEDMQADQDPAARLVAAAVRLKELLGPDSPYREVCEDVIRGFPVPRTEGEDMNEHDQLLERARLVAGLYEGPHSITDIDLGERDIADQAGRERTQYELMVGNPDRYVILPHDFHPSQGKILESIAHQWPLGPALVLNNQSNAEREVILFPANDPQVQELTRALRYAKDAGDRAQQERVRAKVHEYVWEHLDDYGKARVEAARREGRYVDIRYLTIRDKPPEEDAPDAAERKNVNTA